MSLRAYAKHRGCALSAVQRAIESSRLSKSVGRDGQGHPKITDAALADAEWAANTQADRAPIAVQVREAERPALPAPPPPRPTPGEPTTEDEAAVHLGMGLAEASAAEKVWKAKLAELDFRERAGELVNAKEVAETITDVFARCRTRLLGLPTRARQQLPHLTSADVGTLDALVREGLEALAVELSREPEQEHPAQEAVGA